MRPSTIYSASDKAMFDALNQKNVTNNDLRELFLSRGIIVSKDTPRRALALYFSRIAHDFDDYQRLAKLFGSKNYRDRTHSARVKTATTLQTFEAAANELKSELESDGCVVRVVNPAPGRMEIEVRYKSVHFNKSEFRQVVSRTAHIVVEKKAGEYIIYNPSNDDAQEWVDELITKVNSRVEAPVEVSEIQLPTGISVERKSEFFSKITKSLSGFSFIDVSDVYVTKPKPHTEDSDEDEEESDLGVHISKASLRGEGVLQSKELKLLAGRKFYISKIVWTAKKPTLDSDIYEFEAKFDDSENCANFSFLPLGFYRYQAPKQYSSTRTACSTDEDHQLSVLIEQAARKVLQEFKQADDNEQD